MFNKVVLFGEDGAKIMVNPPDLDSYLKREDVLLNPDTKHVNHIPRQFWKKAGDTVSVMSDQERQGVLYRASSVIPEMKAKAKEVAKTMIDLPPVAQEIKTSGIKVHIQDKIYQDMYLKIEHLERTVKSLQESHAELKEAAKLQSGAQEKKSRFDLDQSTIEFMELKDTQKRHYSLFKDQLLAYGAEWNNKFSLFHKQNQNDLFKVDRQIRNIIFTIVFILFLELILGFRIFFHA